ncbi:MAG: metallophosphoesterase [Phycisphaerae bacterium]|nr:metallophosphoesterase [Phycisphaerae bacterium]MDW8262992.1 metallophosphoesterase [Phycisphaerales bacterium]
MASLPADLTGLRLIHLSDLHLTGRWYAAHEALLARIAQADADLICFTGDLVENRWNPRPALNNARRFMEHLRSRLGTFAILGNHDGDLLAPYLARWNCHLLHPGVAELRWKGAKVEIIGLCCVARTDLRDRWIRSIPPRRPDGLRIVLSHFPDHIHRLAALQPDLVLAGHTHGGQVCLPGGRAVLTHDSLPTSMAAGIYSICGTRLVISRGVGFATFPIRLFSPPEVCELTLTPPTGG